MSQPFISEADKLEMHRAFQSMSLPEIFSFLTTMLHHRILCHRQVRALVSIAFAGDDDNQLSAHVVSSTDNLNEKAVLLKARAAIERRLQDLAGESS